MKDFKLLLAFFLGLAMVGCGAGTSRDESKMDSHAPATPRDTADTHLSMSGSIAAEVHPDAVSPEYDISSQNTNCRSEDAIVQEDVRKVLNAVYQADIPTVLAYTHPKIIELMGGSTQAESTLETVLSRFRSLDMKVESLSFPGPPDFLETAANRFVIVPTKSIVSANGQQVESLNYQFGIQEKGTTTWKYIEGSRIGNANVHLLFPDFPPNYRFPETYRTKL